MQRKAKGKGIKAGWTPAAGAISCPFWCVLLTHGTEEVVVLLCYFCRRRKQPTNRPACLPRPCAPAWQPVSLPRLPRGKTRACGTGVSVEKHLVSSHSHSWRHRCRVVFDPSAWVALPVALVLPGRASHEPSRFAPAVNVAGLVLSSCTAK
jgi:hypothetical protein